MFKLSIEDDEGKTTVVPLARDEMTVGRLEGNTIRLTERNVSRKHARLSRQNGALFIEDLASFTGVRVNGTKIASPTPLREGDEVQIGDYKLVLRGDRPPVTDRPTTPEHAGRHHGADGDRGGAGGDPHPGIGRRDGRAASQLPRLRRAAAPAPFADEDLSSQADDRDPRERRGRRRGGGGAADHPAARAR